MQRFARVCVVSGQRGPGHHHAGGPLPLPAAPAGRQPHQAPCQRAHPPGPLLQGQGTEKKKKKKKIKKRKRLKDKIERKKR